jgi:ankyrin repeat protein
MISAATADTASHGSASEDPGAELRAAAEEGRVEDVARLVAAGADVNGVNAFGATALHLAGEFNSVGVMELLVSAGAGLDAPNGDGWSPLMDAAFSGSIPAMEFLLQAGADWRLEVRSDDGAETAMSLATGKARDVLAAWEADHGGPAPQPEPDPYD